jgi:acetylornithine deacetylase
VTEIEQLTRRLVEIPSHEDEHRAGDAVEDWLREHTDADVERDTHGNVIARRGGGDPSLALVGHHDVVPPDERQIADGEYVVERRDGRLYGRGTADMKGALAAAMTAFRDATVTDGTLIFVSFVGEEVGGEGARAAIDDGFAPDRAVVVEGSTGYSGPGVTDVAVGHKGRRASTVHAEGTAAHASKAELGENAIYRAADAVEALRDLPAPETTVLGHEVTGSVVVTEIEGGSAWNVVPDTCRVTVDERTVPGERAPLGDVADAPDVQVEIKQDLPPMACHDEAFADLVLDAARKRQEETPGHVVKPHATDAGWLADAGTACVVCGPAEPGEAHTADESVSLDVLARCGRIYRAVAERVVG